MGKSPRLKKKFPDQVLDELAAVIIATEMEASIAAQAEAALSQARQKVYGLAEQQKVLAKLLGFEDLQKAYDNDELGLKAKVDALRP